MTKYFVSIKGLDANTGSKNDPFLTINKAAKVAKPGDTVIVREGTYREWVNPQRGGDSNSNRIIYEPYKDEKVIIKGSEQVNNWEKIEKSIWKATLNNDIFGDFNPYVETAIGDWLVYRSGKCHLGDVYLNGKSFYEVETYEELLNPTIRTEIKDNWTEEIIPILDSDQTKYVWFCKVDETHTYIYANFHDFNPNEELVEVNIRRSVFYPKENGINYITVRGFEMAQAATPWSPPTADQPGLVGPNWSKGWIIENNIIHDSKCSAISIGKEKSTGNNESTFIGDNVIRNNTIYDCGQNGIVGHLGCVFSEIYDNQIYNIALKREFYGHEIAGIKLHSAIDVFIHDNYIYNCSLGIWLDWEAQGVRVSKNVLFNNSRDLFIEVTHGPHLIDNNILGSNFSLLNVAQGGAFIHNIFAGKIEIQKVLDRSTQYHLPHSTEVNGFSFVYGGDDRYFQNIFLGSNKEEKCGTSVYNYTSITSLEEYINSVNELRPGDHNIFGEVEQPVYISSNAYLGNSEPYFKESNAHNFSNYDTGYNIEINEDGVRLKFTLPEDYKNCKFDDYSTKDIPKVRIVNAYFENFDGSDLTITPNKLFKLLKPGVNEIKL